MAGCSIKLFEFNRKFSHLIGIRLPQNRSMLNAKNVILVICLSQFVIALVGFLVYDAKSMGEYSAAFFPFVSGIEALSAYVITIWEFGNILKFIENCEKFIEMSK